MTPDIKPIYLEDVQTALLRMEAAGMTEEANMLRNYIRHLESMLATRDVDDDDTLD